jgi:lipopolysaccharide/colanic/teichoic acid biosynthesis glycosyltransferase
MNRISNLLIASVALVVLLPLIATIAVMVRLVVGKPVIFRQERPGLAGRPFRLLKFRTMRDATDAQGRPLPDKDRLTPFGAMLRRSSLDELPELWNVIRGDMNLVGPRPLLPEYLSLYTREQFRRHEVPPGITGWAQVNGRNSLSWEEKFALDTWYVDQRNFMLDIKILGMTVAAIFRTGEINQQGHVSAEKFKGSK